MFFRDWKKGAKLFSMGLKMGSKGFLRNLIKIPKNKELKDSLKGLYKAPLDSLLSLSVGCLILRLKPLKVLKIQHCTMKISLMKTESDIQGYFIQNASL